MTTTPFETEDQSTGLPARAQSFDRRMLESLICPVTHQTLVWDAEALELVSKAAGLAFPVRDGIPIMLVSQARALG